MCIYGFAFHLFRVLLFSCLMKYFKCVIDIPYFKVDDCGIQCFVSHTVIAESLVKHDQSFLHHYGHIQQPMLIMKWWYCTAFYCRHNDIIYIHVYLHWFSIQNVHTNMGVYLKSNHFLVSYRCASHH